MAATILTLGGLLAAFAAVPLLIHLINMMRHRRVQWAAMDFLLASYKRHRNWVWLKQLLLLLSRMAAMVLLALMLCIMAHSLIDNLWEQLGFGNQAMGLLGGRTTHHYVLLDDSFSMQDRSGGATALDHGREAIRRIAQRAMQNPNQRFTLIRYSRALGGVEDTEIQAASDQIADINAADVGSDFDELLEEQRTAIEGSQLAVGPGAAINVVRQLVEQREDEQAVVYLVGDFRAKDWNNPAEITKSLQPLKDKEAEIHLVNCVKTRRENLALVDLQPEADIQAAGVPLFVNVTVKNFGDQAATNVQAKVHSLFYDPSDTLSGNPELSEPQIEELPTVLFEEIPAGQTATRRIQVYFPQAGRHVVMAELEEDTVSTDNRRWCVVDFLEGVPVLIVDSSPTLRNGYYLAAVFDPDGRKNTGIQPEVQRVAYLRDATPDLLDRFHTIYLADIDINQLNQTAIQNLEDFVRRGGGLAIFMGPHVLTASYNEKMYREGQGLLPLPLDQVYDMPADTVDETADIVATEHPVFSAVVAERNPLINMVTLSRYYRPPIEWNVNDHPDVEIIARSREGDPLTVNRRFGQGQVVAFLTTLAPDWTNWPKNPTFVVMSLRLQAYLASGRRTDLRRDVGSAIAVSLESEKYRKDVTFVAPTVLEEDGRTLVDRPAVKQGADSVVMTATLGQSPETQRPNGETGLAGVYESWSFGVDGRPDVNRFALNVEPTEGDLAIVDPTALLGKLDRLEPKYIAWDQIDPEPVQRAGFSWGKWLLLILIALLIGEQILAYMVSYHPASRSANR